MEKDLARFVNFMNKNLEQLKTISIFCQSADEKKNAILWFVKFGAKPFDNGIGEFSSGATWRQCPYVYFTGDVISANVCVYSCKKIVNFKDLSNFKFSKIREPKWKNCWKND